MPHPAPARVGLDAVELPRFRAAVQRWGERLLQRLFTPHERRLTRDRLESLAARFAAKEAVAKALGTGIGPIAWREIEILRAPSGEPVVHLHGAAAHHAQVLRLHTWAVSLTHTRTLALAVVMAWGPPEAEPCA